MRNYNDDNNKLNTVRKFSKKFHTYLLGTSMDDFEDLFSFEKLSNI